MLKYSLSQNNAMTERVTLLRLKESDGRRLRAAAEVGWAKFTPERRG